MNSFLSSRTYGADKLKTTPLLLLLLVFGIFVAFVLAKIGIVAALGLLLFPFCLFYLYQLFTYPKIGLYSSVLLGFVANGLARYVDVPFGLLVDIVLVLTYLAIVLKKEKYDWTKAKNGLTLSASVWMLYSFFEIFNPEARSFEAWFYAMRGVSFYFFLAVPLVFLLFNSTSDLHRFFSFWFILSLFGTFIGLKQQFFGVDAFEQAWLDAGAAKQHLLFGKLRVFSFYSDAGQFGASQAHTFVAACILFLSRDLARKQQLFYGLVAIFSLIGMMISGTRGAIAVPAIGMITYLFFSKNFKIFGVGIATGLFLFYLLKFTFIGQGIYAINRMRTALDPNDASLLVRLENQRKLADYLVSRPFGGGIGSAGNWGLRFSPNSFLAQTPTDSWYVRIWAEEGVVGLGLHLIILLYIAIKGGITLWKLPNGRFRQQLLAIYAGALGIFVASYGNGVLGQMPTGILLYIGWAFLMMKPKKFVVNKKT